MVQASRLTLERGGAELARNRGQGAFHPFSFVIVTFLRAVCVGSRSREEPNWGSAVEEDMMFSPGETWRIGMGSFAEDVMSLSLSSGMGALSAECAFKVEIRVNES